MKSNQGTGIPFNQTSSGYAPVNGVTMYFEVYGSGAPLVLIHGGGSTIQSTFGRVIPGLAQSKQVIAMDLQAHGRTSDRPGPETFEQDADDVAALLHYLDIHSASVFGFSNGGNTAMQLAIRHPQLVNKLVIASSFYKREGLPEGFFEGMAQATIDHMPQSLKDAFLQVNPNKDQLLNMFNKDRERMLHFENWPASYLQEIKVPVFVIAADKDVASNQHTVEMFNHFTDPAKQLLIVPGFHGCYIEVAESAGGSNALTSMTLEAVIHFLDEG